MGRARAAASKAKVAATRERVEAITEAEEAAVETAAAVRVRARERAAVATDDPALAEALAHSGGNLLTAHESVLFAPGVKAGELFERNAAWWEWFHIVEAQAAALAAWQKAANEHALRKLADKKYRGRFTEKRPATPDLDRYDAIKHVEAPRKGKQTPLTEARVAEVAALITELETDMPKTSTPTKTTTKKANGSAPVVKKTPLTTPPSAGGRYYVDGVAVSEKRNKMLDVAWDHTAGIEKDRPARIRGQELVALIEASGKGVNAFEPSWMVKLPNGKTLELRREGEQPKVKAAPKPEPVKKATAPKATTSSTPKKAAAKKAPAKKSGAQKAREATPLPKASAKKATAAAATTRKTSRKVVA